ncbi:YhcH/YjgK/YiaL family protein [Costertonia aggregata]|uniref:YhcH/YjgK/YiaL family protein n=1 Tax=Costertonia aggregata TaxID=343403 RepID=A0A7H9AP78_9FLAO|nr:YhcH/YjgK/YiaL family protein [Costertonia aggregata]QLG45248.1 YhcH/YjgK/YiaL family protein [Costertonia aggregata]
MIYDDIDNWEKYFNTTGIFREVFDTLSEISVNTPNGEYSINDSCYYKVMSYETKIDPTIIESHIREVDKQIVLEGGEGISIYDNSEVEIISPYDSKTDCEFYKGAKKSNLDLRLMPGKMAVFFPQDIHGCQHALDGTTETIKKL